MSSTTSSMLRLLVALGLVTASALCVGPTGRAPRIPSIALRTRSPRAVLAPADAGASLGAGVAGVAATQTSAAALLPALQTVDLPSTVLVADLIDIVQGFADSPLILLIPIGAGAAVAGIIMYVLVKSAG